MSAINVSAVMQALADRLVAAGVVSNAYGWPVRSAKPVCAIVGYPDGDIDFDATFGRGSDRAVFPVYVVCGNVHDESTRDVISGYITGATGVKDALDGNLGGAVQTARVTGARVDLLTLAGADYLTARFDVEIWS